MIETIRSKNCIMVSILHIYKCAGYPGDNKTEKTILWASVNRILGTALVSVAQACTPYGACAPCTPIVPRISPAAPLVAYATTRIPFSETATGTFGNGLHFHAFPFV